MDWTPKDERAFRTELERRFTERTPPTRIDEVNHEYRVGRSEMRRWCLDTLGKPLAEAPDIDESSRCRWMKRMTRRVRLMAGELHLK